MSYFEKNLQVLQVNNLYLYNRVCEWLKEEKTVERFVITMSKNGHPTLQIIEGDKRRFLTSAYNPVQEAERWALNQPTKDSYIVHGFGLAYHIEELIKKEAKHILVIDLNKEIFCLALEHRDLEWLFTNRDVVLAIADDDTTIKNQMMLVLNQFDSKFDMVTANAYNQVFVEEQMDVESMLNEVIGNYILDANTLSFFGKQWTENFFKNLYPTLTNAGVKGLFNKFTNMPVVIVSAGPSLSKNVHLLKEMKGKALLLCVGTAYKVLENHGIKPDLLISFDGSYKNYQIFEKLDIRDIPLIYDPTIYHQIVQEYKGPVIPARITDMFTDYFEDKLDMRLGDILQGCSIANVAFDAAYQFGGNPIIFVGQDLAFTGGQTHSKGTIYEKEQVKAEGSLSEVYLDGIDGGKVLSNRSFRTFLRWFEKIISLRPDRTYINATEGGANISGTRVMKLEKVIKEYCQREYQITEIIEDFLSNSLTTEQQEEIAQNAHNLLKDIKHELLHFKKKNTRGLKLLDELEILFKRPEANAKRIGKILQSLDKLDATLMSSEDEKIFLNMIFQPLFFPLLKGRDATGSPDETEEEAIARIIRFNRNLYDGFQEISKCVLTMVDGAIETFAEKISEVSLKEE